MPYLRDQVIILACEPMREHDAWVTMYGRERGKMEVVARGARRQNAKHLGHLEPFQTADVMVAKGRAFDKLAVARVCATRSSLRQTLPGIAFAGCCTRATAALSRVGETHHSFFSLLEDALGVAEKLPRSASELRVRWLAAGFGWKLLEAAGYAPRMDRCARCRSALDDRSGPDPRWEGALCFRCVGQDALCRLFPPLVMRLLQCARTQPLARLAGITAPRSVLEEASAWILALYRHAPLREEPDFLFTHLL